MGMYYDCGGVFCCDVVFFVFGGGEGKGFVDCVVER